MTQPEPNWDDEDDDGSWVVCYECDGDGHIHDCGEDCCVCLHPEEDELVPCRGCDGRGGWRESL